MSYNKIRRPLLCAALCAAGLATLLMPVVPQRAAAAPVAYVDTTGSKPIVRIKNGTGTYIPYLIYGVHLRIDSVLGSYTPGVTSWTGTGSGMDGADYYFSQAAACGFKTVVVPVFWNWVDYSPNAASPSYNFSYIQQVINSASKYGLNVQLTWDGSDVCGYSNAPAYVTSNPKAYPLNAAHPQFLNLSNANLISAESKALVAMVNYIAANDTTGRIVMVEIECEPDGAGPLASSLQWGNTTNMAGLMYAGGQFAAVNALVNTLGTAVANSNWKGVTRVNIGASYRSIDVVNYRAGLSSGVDIFDVDLYDPSLTDNHNTLAQLAPPALFSTLSPSPWIDPLTSNVAGTRSKYTRNVTHQPEGGGQYGDLCSLVLQNFADGGGSLIYELRTTASWQVNGVWQPVYDLGIYRRTTTANDGAAVWTPRTGSPNLVDYNLDGTNPQLENSTADIVTLNSTIYKCDQKLASATPTTCAAFNLNCTGWTPGVSETLNVGSVPITYQAWTSNPAFAMQDTNGDLILLNLADGNDFTIGASFLHGATASVGYYDSSNVWHEQYTKPFSGNTLLCWKGEVVRVVKS